MPSRYHPNIIKKVEKLKSLGANQKDISNILGVCEKTLANWANKYPDFSKVITKKIKKGVYSSELDEQARKLCLLGYTNDELGKFFGVSKRSIDKWIAEKPSFGDAVKQGKDYADARMAESLYQRGLGYSHKAINFSTVGGKVVETEYVKHHPPETAAGIFWLKNRQSQKWRDKREVAVENADELTPWSEISAEVDE